ncbi:hypothetical protein ALC60_02617 [Trachymyrmex zeteki]|uniref:Uncharacterized protein n=1 Tax=Mycetomoellerius zeteki TaxID=64791 RepID=A0A151XD56_9HYME|nr:hypothetical protein ALC60_02617 [Trachymyrmex zeteki]
MKEDGVRSRTGLHTSIRRRSPAPTGFFSVSSPPPGPFWLYLPAARPTFYSNLLVLTCSLLYPLLSRDPPPFASFPTFPPSACRPHSRASRVGPQCSIHRVTKRTAQASADLPGSHFRLDGNPRDTHTVDVVFVLLSISLIAKDLNSQTVRGVRSADSLKFFYGLLRSYSPIPFSLHTIGSSRLIDGYKGIIKMRRDRCTKDNGPGPKR